MITAPGLVKLNGMSVFSIVCSCGTMGRRLVDLPCGISVRGGANTDLAGDKIRAPAEKCAQGLELTDASAT